MTSVTRRAALATALGLLPLLALTACGSDDEKDPGAADIAEDAKSVGLEISTSPDQDRVRSTESEEAIALLPDEYKDKDTFVVSISAGTAPPLGFLADDDTTPIGSETDIAQLVADGLGKKLELSVNAWADWPLAVQSGKVDAVISNVTVTEERKELYDFATYRNDILGWLTSADNDEITSISSAEDIAGRTISVSSGTNQEKIVLAWDKENTDAGRKAATIEYFENNSDVLLAIQSGRIEAYVGPNASAAYQAAVSPDRFKVVGTLNGGWPENAQIAVATVKGNGLVDAVNASLLHAIENGSYTKVLQRWGLEAEALKTSEINPPGLPKP